MNPAPDGRRPPPAAAWVERATPGLRWLRDGPRVVLLHEGLGRRSVLNGESAVLATLLLTHPAAAALQRFVLVSGRTPKCAAELRHRLERAHVSLGLLQEPGGSEERPWPT